MILNILLLELFGKMGKNNKSGFGNFPKVDSSQWDYFKENNEPVSVITNGTKYCGKVYEINKSQNYIRLQPALFTDSYGTRISLEDKPVFVPFDSIPSAIAEGSLEEFAQSWNNEKLQERIKEGKTRIIIPK